MLPYLVDFVYTKRVQLFKFLFLRKQHSGCQIAHLVPRGDICTSAPTFFSNFTAGRSTKNDISAPLALSVLRSDSCERGDDARVFTRSVDRSVVFCCRSSYRVPVSRYLLFRCHIITLGTPLPVYRLNACPALR